jgi:hypothetical protein
MTTRGRHSATNQGDELSEGQSPILYSEDMILLPGDAAKKEKNGRGVGATP